MEKQREIRDLNKFRVLALMLAKNHKNVSVIYSTKLHDRTKGYLNNTLTQYNR